MSVTLEEIQKYVPHYLSLAQAEGLAKALSEFPKCNYYISAYMDEVLQGDGWTAVEVLRFSDGARRSIKAMVLSNSCDIEPSNKRDVPPLITFAPLMTMTTFQNVLESAGLNEAQRTAKIKALREQKISSLFHLPKGGALEEEHVVLLADLHTVPLDHYLKLGERKKLFTLSDVGFYVFLMKLSIHFCRMHEEVDRTAA